ncbi:MAG: hypothetical protein CML57_05565 [Rhodobacteraceae bacterium]|nr:hypothetical protein [Paracoccaceae bacterium]
MRFKASHGEVFGLIKRIWTSLQDMHAGQNHYSGNMLRCILASKHAPMTCVGTLPHSFTKMAIATKPLPWPLVMMALVA